MNDKDHHIRISHTERRIAELEQELEESKLKLSRQALHIAELEAAVLRLDEKKANVNQKWWSYLD